jgi:hypothetical protein
MAVTEKDWYQKGLQLRQKGHYQKAIHAFNQAIDNKIKFAIKSNLLKPILRGVYVFISWVLIGRPQAIWRQLPCWAVRPPNFGANTIETDLKNQMKITNLKFIPLFMIMFTNMELRHKGL